MADFHRPVHCLLGLPFDAVSLTQAARRLEDARASGRRCFLSTPNLNFLVASQRSAAFRDSVCRSDLSVADGMPLIWLSRLLGVPLRERVSGSGLFDFLRQRSTPAWNVFFFGGQPGAGEAACAVLGRRGPHMRAAGHLNPGFGSAEDMSRTDWIDIINASGADFVVVSLGSAKGQDWISRNLDRLRPPVVSHLGAVVNFVAGTVARAPRWMQRSGLEWLWRIKEEPALWKRYALDGLALLRLLLTRVLPLALLQRRSDAAAAKAPPPRLQWPDSPGRADLRLAGAWRDDRLAPLREAFTTLLARGGDVRLDLGEVTHLGSGFAGLLLLLDTALRDRGQRLHLRGLKPHARRLLSLHGALPENTR